MSIRLKVLNALLRNIVKPRLARATNVAVLRRGLRRAAALLPPPPSEARFGPAPHLRPLSERGLDWWWCAAPATAPHMAPGGANARAILFLHGGAYVSGSPETHRSLIWALAKAAQAPVAAIDYRLAPEHPFPAAFEDAVNGFRVLERVLGPRARIAIAGDSAGGGLAVAVAAALAGDDSTRSRPAALALFSPLVDLALTGRSLKRNARRDPMLPSFRIGEAASAYLQGANPRDPRASPLYAEWRRPPPPTLIQASRAEALSDDAVRLGDSLRRAGGDVRLELWRSTPHAWQFFAPYVSEAAVAVEAAGRFLAARLDSAERPEIAPSTATG